MTKGQVFYNELNDVPNHPWAYGEAGWTEGDQHLLLYDRYDIWKYNPDTGERTRLTKGRENKTVYRYIKLDNEQRHIPTNEKWLLSTFNETTKGSGYAEYNPKNKQLKELISGPYRYSTPKKALLNDALLYTRESFQEFPDLRISTSSFKNDVVLSNANPQQVEYNWGTIELTNWVSLDGKELMGMLVKPENFDPSKKYPLLVNFYEKKLKRTS